MTIQNVLAPVDGFIAGHQKMAWYVALLLSVMADLIASAWLRIRLESAVTWRNFAWSLAPTLFVFLVSITLVGFLLWKSPTYTGAALVWSVALVIGSVAVGFYLGDGQSISPLRLICGGVATLIALWAFQPQ